MDSAAQGAAKNMILERLVNPPVKSGAPQEGSGYTSDERALMQRAIKDLQ
jgi:hypothetical protein